MDPSKHEEAMSAIRIDYFKNDLQSVHKIYIINRVKQHTSAINKKEVRKVQTFQFRLAVR